MSNFRPFLSTLHSLVGLQIISRLVTFGLNQSLIRIASPTVYGTAAIQFELIRETVLFLGREAVRGVILREGRRESKPRSTSRVLAERTIDLRFLPPVLGIFVIASLVPIYVHLLPSSSTSQALYYPSLSCYLASAILELTAEPAILGAQLGLFEWNIQDATSVRAKAEGLAVIARAIVTFVLILTARYLGQGDRDGYTLLGFASGQMAFSITLLAAWCQAIGTQAGKDLFASGRLYYHKGLQLCTHVE
jgi:oligosaccharide translocation protein RFT1